MNIIKYFNPETGKQRRVRIVQPSYAKMARWKRGQVRRPTLAEADELMRREGFVRCGLRRGSLAARRAA